MKKLIALLLVLVLTFGLAGVSYGEIGIVDDIPQEDVNVPDTPPVIPPTEEEPPVGEYEPPTDEDEPEVILTLRERIIIRKGDMLNKMVENGLMTEEQAEKILESVMKSNGKPTGNAFGLIKQEVNELQTLYRGLEAIRDSF